jgi:hypothetical protein
MDQTKLDSSRAPQLQFGIQQMADNSVLSAQGLRRIVLAPTGLWVNYIAPEIVDQLEFKPYCTKDGEPIWQTSEKKAIRTQELVETGLLLLFDVAHKAIRGEL